MFVWYNDIDEVTRIQLEDRNWQDTSAGWINQEHEGKSLEGKCVVVDQ
jgi:hypothetical protein